jgi:hypothetical protein
LPLERDVSIAKSHLKKLKDCHKALSGFKKGGVTRNINSLERQIALYEQRAPLTGTWYLNTVFYTDYSGQVELLAHKYLNESLDRNAPIGEVFSCSAAEATHSVEAALDQLGLLDAATKATEDYSTSEKYGECPICGKHLSRRGVCMDCSILYNS